MKNYLIFISLFFFQLNLNAQFFEQFSTDDIPELGVINEVVMHDDFIYYHGLSIDSSFYDLVIRKVDTSGNVIWSITIPENPQVSNIQDFIVSDDGYLYVNIYGVYFNTIPYSDIWKIDQSNGSIIYKYDYSNISDFNSFLTNLIDYQTDTLLFTYNSNDDGIGGATIFGGVSLGFFDKVNGEIVSSSRFSNSYGTVLPIVDEEKNIYYFKGDSLFKGSIYEPEIKIWSAYIPITSVTEIYFDELTNNVFVFGDGSAIGRVISIDGNTGNTNWDFETNSSWDVRYRDMIFGANHIYITWQHAYVGGGTYYVNATKMDKVSGTLTWESETTYAENSNAQAGIDIELDVNEDVYLTGYFDIVDWGILKLDGTSGDDLFKTLVTHNSESPSAYDNVGIRILPLNGKTIVFGNQKIYNNKVETFISIDNTTGEILSKKYIGGLAKFSSSFSESKQFSNGQIVKGEQNGNFINFSFQDEFGEIEWDTIINLSVRTEITSLEIFGDSLIGIGATAYADLRNLWNNKFEYILFNRNKEIVLNQSWDSENDEIEIIDAVQTPNSILASVTYKDGNEEGHRFYQIYNFNISNGNDSENEIQFSNTNNKVVYSHNSSILQLGEQGIYEYVGSNGTTHSYPNVSYFNHFDSYQDSLFIACGLSLQDKTIIAKVSKNTLEANYVNELPINGTGVKWVEGEDESIIYILTNNNENELILSKYDVESKFLYWSEIIATGNGELLYSSDIGFNKIGNYVTVIGYKKNVSTDDSKLLINFYKPSGKRLVEIIRDGNFEGDNKALSLLSHELSDVTIVGGSYHNVPDLTDAFSFYYNREDLDRTVKTQIFLDENENGIKDVNETGVALGHLNIDGTNQIFPNENGCSNILLTEGLHEVAYNLPSNWNLTTDSLSYNILIDNLMNIQDTLLFGIAPIVTEDKVEAFIFSQPLICDREASMYLQFKNTGTTIQNVNLEMSFVGEFSNTSYPSDSLIGQKIYWSFDSLAPGSAQIIDLEFLVPGVSFLGETIEYKVDVFHYDVVNPTIVGTSSFDYKDILLCAYDPNDKQVTPLGIGDEQRTLFDQYLYYTIRFQNTGNYQAFDIEIRDTLDTDLDLNTFEFLAASHLVTSISKEGNAISFMFDDINLPDSLSNEPESHGFVSFRVKPKNGLPENTEIENTGHIYFDLNPAIVTNEILNTLVSELFTSTNDLKLEYSYLEVFPNPFQESTTLILKNLDKKENFFVDIIDVNGKLINSLPSNMEGEIKFDGTNFSSGLYFYFLRNKFTKEVIDNGKIILQK